LTSTAVDALLECLDDRNVKRIAVAALWELSNGFPGALEVLLGYLDPEDRYVRTTAYTLGRCTSLPSKALDALLNRLGDVSWHCNWHTENEIIGALKSQSTLPLDIIHKIALQFSTDDITKSREVLAPLQNRDEFYRWLPNMDWPYFMGFYQISQRWSFENTYVLILQDRGLVVQLRDTQKVIPIPSIRDRLKLRAYFALAQFLVLNGERREVRWVMKNLKTMRLVKAGVRFASFAVFPIAIAMLLAYFWF
jgi:hypothetical protein